MLKPVLSGALGLWAMAGLFSAPAAAGECCDCGYVPRAYGYSYAPAPAYFYESPVFYRRFHPRWQYSAAYYNPPPPARVYSYGYVARGPAVFARPYRYWRRW